MKGIIKSISLYLSANIINALIPFLLLPILTRYLTQEEYGKIGMFQTLLAALAAFIGLSAHASASRKFYDQKITSKISAEFNGACLQILVFTALLLFFIVQLFPAPISQLLLIPVSWISGAIIVSSSLFIIQLRLSQWQIRNKPKLFGLFQISQSLLNMILSICWIIFLSKGAQGRVDAQLISGIIFAVISIIFLYKDKIMAFFSWHPVYIKEALIFGVPLIPHALGFLMLTYIDRFLISQKLGLIYVGIYILAAQVSLSMNIFFDAINKAYVPWLFQKLSNHPTEIKIKIVKYTYLHFLIALSLAAIAFIFGPSFIILIAGEKYSLSGKIIGLLCLGQAFNGMYLMVTNYLFFTKKTSLLSLVTLFSGILHVIFLYIFLNHYGIIGAGISYSLSKFIQFLLTWYIANKAYPMPWFSVLRK